MEPGEASLTITGGTAYVDRARAYKVMLDGAELGRIKNDTTSTFSVPPGCARAPSEGGLGFLSGRHAST